MKRKKLISLIGGVLCLAMLITVIVPNLLALAAPPLEVLNPWGEIQPQTNLPLAARPGTLDGGKIGLLYFNKLGGAEFTAAIKAELQAEYTGLTFEETRLDATYAFAQPTDWYDAKGAEYDAVIISLANDGSSAYWGSVHASEFEKRGVPAAMVLTSTYAPTFASAAEDHGMTALRSVVIDIEAFTKAYGAMTTGIVPIANDLFPALDAALTDALTAAERNPLPITPVDALADFVIPSLSYERQLKYFNDLAMNEGFGDGLPLVLPTREAVDDMLAATERSPDEVLGKIRMRYGICTIEKIAINAVMAGAEPEYFPVIIAAMEALVDGIEDKSLFHAALTADDNYMLMMIVSGPIAKELDFNTDRGYMTAGLRNNTTIGRAVMLAFQNIGHNTKPYVDTSRYGRHMEHTALVFAENVAQFPQGWISHSETMGYAANQSSVTVVAVGRMGHDDQWVNNEPFAVRTDQILLDTGMAMLLGRAPGLPGANSVRRLANLPVNPVASTDIMMLTLSPSHAALLLEAPETTVSTAYDHDFGQTIPSGSGISDKRNLVSKEGIREWWTNNGVKNGTTGVGGTTQISLTNVTNPDIPFAAHKNITQLLLVGENPTYSLIYPSKFLGTHAYRTQLVTGATITAAGRDAAAPSQPTNFTARALGPDSIKLAWEAPARTNGDITYEVSSDDGATWLNVGTAQSYVYAGLDFENVYTFVVRAVNDADNARIYDSSDFELSDRGSGRGAQARLIRAVNATPIIYLSGPSTVGYSGPSSPNNENATYTVTVENLPSSALWIKLKFTVSSTYFDALTFSIPDEFLNFTSFVWNDIGGGMMEGVVEITRGLGIYGIYDILKLTFSLNDLTAFLGSDGLLPDITTAVKLDVVEFGTQTVWLAYDMGADTVNTKIVQWYSVFDINKDRIIDGRDVAFAMQFYMMTDDDPGWNAAAASCDLNGDGRIDVIDLVLIYSNFS